jgi:hypothetical protein
MSRALEASAVDALWSDLPSEKGLATFTRRLRERIRDEEPAPFLGMDLPTTLEVVMKVARFRIECVETSMDNLAEAEPSAAVLLATQVCDDFLSLVVWLRRLRAPAWLFQRLYAEEILHSRAVACEAADDPAGAMHWYVGVLCLPATLLGANAPIATGLHRRAIQALPRAARGAPARALGDAFEVWNDLLASYDLYERPGPQQTR